MHVIGIKRKALGTRSALLTILIAGAVAICAPARAEWWNGFAPPEQGGQGMNGRVRALALYQGALVAGGDFTEAGGTAASHVALWDGTSWHALGSGTDGPVWCLRAQGNDLFAGGAFTTAGGLAASRVAKWDGASWHPLGGGVDSTVACLYNYQGKLIAGGYFTHADGSGAGYIADWDGSSWSPLGSGVNSWVYSLQEYGGELAVGGFFTRAGGSPAYRMAAWNGSSWSAPYDVINGPIWGLATWQQAPPSPLVLVALGFYELAGHVLVGNIGRWDGTAWSAFDSGVNATATCATGFQGSLYAGGNFTLAGREPAFRIARWDGTVWDSLGSGVDAIVRSLVVQDGSLFVGGDFATAGGLPSAFIARWDGMDPAGVSAGCPGCSSTDKRGDRDGGRATGAAGSGQARLLEVRPNPSAAGAQLSLVYELPAAGQATVTIHDPVGRLLFTLQDGFNQPGLHQVYWDGRDTEGRVCGPGVFLVRLEVEGHINAGRILRVR